MNRKDIRNVYKRSFFRGYREKLLNQQVEMEEILCLLFILAILGATDGSRGMLPNIYIPISDEGIERIGTWWRSSCTSTKLDGHAIQAPKYLVIQA